MPELPEVETVRLQLLAKVLNKKISKIEVFKPKSAGDNPNFSKILKGNKFSNISRIGKLLIFSFVKEKNLFLLTHLKMTGQFFYRNKKTVTGSGHTAKPADSKDLPNSHTRIAFQFSDGTSLYFNDMRIFGYMKIASLSEVEFAKSRYGQEPISIDFDTDKFFTILQRRNTSIKAALLDQTFVAGLGNIYVDESLYLAKISPLRKASEVTRREAKLLAKVSGQIMNKAITVGGTTFQHFVDTGGETGNYTDYLRVFGKQNTPCPRCKKTVEKIRVAGRGTHYCPNCQK
jgi:formamidopyrimidine-DNA glycosylase